MKWSSPSVDEAAEKVESGKAAAIAAVAGGVASAPFSLVGDTAAAATAVGATLVSCALFGVVYRCVYTA
jgi:hypothetical protein